MTCINDDALSRRQAANSPALPVARFKVTPSKGHGATSTRSQTRIMELPLQISFRGMDSSPVIEAQIRERAAKLDKFNDRITACRVVVEAHHHHHHKGRLYHIRVDVTVPGHEIVVSREPDEHQAHEDIQVAVRDAFDAARRQIEDHLRIDAGR